MLGMFNPFQTNGICHKATIKSVYSILYIEGSQVIIPKINCILFSEDRFFRRKQCRR